MRKLTVEIDKELLNDAEVLGELDKLTSELKVYLKDSQAQELLIIKVHN